jgi:hypothetical protein
MYLHAELKQRPANSRYPFTQKIVDMTTEEHRRTLLTYVNEEDCWVPSHDRQCLSWIERVNTDLPTCIFNELQAFMRSHFGIDVWTSQVRLPSLSLPPVDQAWKQHLPRNTTLAYLTLPKTESSSAEWSSSTSDNANMPSGRTMPVNAGAVPTEASLRRFPRALNLLGLEVFVPPTEKKAVHSAPTDVQPPGTTDAVDGSAADWPQLTLLTRDRIREP